MKKILVRAIQYILRKRGFVLTKYTQYLGRARRFNIFQYGDYIRFSSLELVAEEIYNNNIQGNVCELGVYQGVFASYINCAFHDRKLYLFDTFEGFDKRDIEKDIQHGFSEANADFSDTSIEIIMEKMKYPQNCIVKKGYFPESAIGLEDIFAFVSIDTDLYEPTYNGLNYFYPRLSPGGYIFVHDYNNKTYSGVKEAVRKFCKENQIAFFPLCDDCGSAIIIK